METEYKCKLTQKPDLNYLRNKGQISGVEQLLARELRLYGLEVVQQLIVPNYDTPTTKSHPLRPDLYLPAKNLIVEVDGCRWHTDDWKKEKRDQRIKEMANYLGQNIDILHLLFKIDQHLIYGHLAEPMRSIVRTEYHRFENMWVNQAITYILNYQSE